jgi:hypothetical protein
MGAVLPDIEKIVALENLLVQGVMTLPPYMLIPKMLDPIFNFWCPCAISWLPASRIIAGTSCLWV